MFHPNSSVLKLSNTLINNRFSLKRCMFYLSLMPVYKQLQRYILLKYIKILGKTSYNY